MVLSNTEVCVIAGRALYGVNHTTKETIALTKKAALENAIKKVTPTFDNDPTAEKYSAVTSDGDSLTIYPAMKDGKRVGGAIESYSKNGFSGMIRVLVGFDAEGKIFNYDVLQHAETPGLGSKMGEWFRTDNSKQSILGRTLKDGGLKVSKDGGDVDAITASTISSRAFLEAVNRAYATYFDTLHKDIDGQSGATQSN